MVRSKEWIVRRAPGPEEEEFSGDVLYEAGDVRLSADWALYRRAARDWQARGSVSLRRDLKGGGSIAAAGDAARLDEADRNGRLEAAPGRRVSLRRDPPGGGPDLGEGRLLTWEGERSALLEEAHVWGPRLELWADRARYKRPEGRLTLEGGRPVLVKLEGGWTTALKAEQITADEAPSRVAARGDVRGWLVFRDEKALVREMGRP